MSKESVLRPSPEVTEHNDLKSDEVPAGELSDAELEGASGGGNFEIQDLMSDFNQAETLAISRQKRIG